MVINKEIKDTTAFKEVFNRLNMYTYTAVAFLFYMYASTKSKIVIYNIKRALAGHMNKLLVKLDDATIELPRCLCVLVENVVHSFPILQKDGELTTEERAEIEEIRQHFPLWCGRIQQDSTVPTVSVKMQDMVENKLVWPFVKANLSSGLAPERVASVRAKFISCVKKFSRNYSYLPSYTEYLEIYEAFLVSLGGERSKMELLHPDRVCYSSSQAVVHLKRVSSNPIEHNPIKHNHKNFVQDYSHTRGTIFISIADNVIETQGSCYSPLGGF